MSQTLTVRCAGTPSAPQLRIDNMDEHGVELAWETPDETGDGCITVSTFVKAFRLYPNGYRSFFTSPKEVMFHVFTRCLSVCLSDNRIIKNY